MVLGEFLVVQAGFGCSRMFLNVLLSFWCSSLVFCILVLFSDSARFLNEKVHQNDWQNVFGI